MEHLLSFMIVVYDADAFERSYAAHFGSLEDFANLPFREQMAFLQAYQLAFPEGVGSEIVSEKLQSLTLSSDDVKRLGGTQDPYVSTVQEDTPYG